MSRLLADCNFLLLVTRQTGGGALARRKVAGLQIDFLVVVTLDGGIHRRIERIDEVHLRLRRHLDTEQVERGIHNQAAQVFISEIH